jgi:hypothetical protein
MRLIVAVILLLSASGALICYQCTKNSQSKTEVEKDQSSANALSLAAHQPQDKNETANTYDASNDCLYRLYLFATIAGVFVALGGIYTIYKQTEATRDAAIAAKQSADNLANSERAWVTVGIENYDRVPRGSLYDVVLTNHGSTPARIVEARGDLQQIDKGMNLQDGPSYQTDILPAKKLLAPKEEWSIRTFGPYATVELVAGGTRPIDKEQVFVGYVAYRHIFDPKESSPHYTRFCFRLQVNGTWQAFGPPDYHEYS